VDQNHTAQLTFSLAGMELDTDIPIKISTSSKPGLTGWIWLENFPWAYTHDEEDWLYFSSGTGKWMYYENADKIWSEINSQNYPVGWLWFNHYPWVYSSTKKGWFYFKASTGQLIYYSNQEKVWRVLEYRK
jgi:hypothetical protein